MSEPIAFPRGGVAGIRYRALLLDVLRRVVREYENDKQIHEVIKHLAHDLSHLDDFPWSGIFGET